MRDFILKSAVITACIFLLLYCFVPRYHFFDRSHRANVITGQSEQYIDTGTKSRWKE